MRFCLNRTHGEYSWDGTRVQLRHPFKPIDGDWPSIEKTLNFIIKELDKIFKQEIHLFNSFIHFIISLLTVMTNILFVTSGAYIDPKINNSYYFHVWKDIH